jgi:hypothetical protein
MFAIVLDVLEVQPQSPTAAMEKSGISFTANTLFEFKILANKIKVVTTNTATNLRFSKKPSLLMSNFATTERQ